MTDFNEIAFRFNKTNDYNCAESVLLAAAELYGFEVTPAELHQVSAFGAGMGCGRLCGTAAGAMAVLGRLTVCERAHVTENFKVLSGRLTIALEDAFGSLNCHDIMPCFRTKELGCVPTIAKALEILDDFLKSNGIV